MIDSYAWLELLSGTEKGQKVKEIIENSGDVYTPGIVLAEIARKLHRDGKDVNVIRSWLESIVVISNIAAIDNALAIQAAICHLELSQNAKKQGLNTPGLTDAIILATCRLLQAKVVTGDEHFKGLPETIWLK